MITVFNRHTFPERQLVKGTAYRGPSLAKTGSSTAQTYRLERGKPYFRRGSVVYATPQFKALNTYSPVSTNSQVPASTQSSTKIAYPVKAR